MAEALQEEPLVNGTSTHDTGHHVEDTPSHTKQRRPSVDRDAQDMVISSLRSQIQDLISQVSQLNNKLVKSYDRVSDLEDDLHVASANVRSSSLKISQLELERTQHLSALNTGLLVERTHVTAELNRLMEKATEEAAQRGQAESARMAIEKDLDDLSASLFGQANSMVAEARYDKHLSERKVEDAERALKSAEEAVQLMQAQMQTIQSEREDAEKKVQDMQVMMGKGKWVERRAGDVEVSLKFLRAHSPYQEYTAFLAHLRVLHAASSNTPAMSTLLQLPFLSRLLTEDSEPTVRLDVAPSLNWLSRRSVLAAIHSGQLTIEPMSATTLFAESMVQPISTTIAGMNSTNDNISCALCGVSIFPTSDSSHNSRPPVHPASHLAQNHTTSWSGSFFKKSNSSNGHAIGITQPPSPTTVNHVHPNNLHPNTQIYIFRLASPSSSIPTLPIPSLTKSASQSSSPIPNSHSSSPASGNTYHSQSGSLSGQPTTIYPLCMSGWCLHRLRTTCTLWAYVRTGIVDKIWEEELPPPPPPPSNIQVEKSANGDKPPIPPRKRGLWGIASAFGERAASWSEGDRDKAKRNSGTTAVPTTQPEPRRLPPPLPPLSSARASSTSSTPPPPPPLPKRSEGRAGRTPAVTPPPRTSSEVNGNGTAHVQVNGSTIANTPPTVAADSPPVPAPHPPPSQDDQPTGKPSDATPPPPSHPHSHIQAAASVPLPDSRPTTPGGPSRTTSPANATPGAGGGAPPPIPRRAAARARVPPGGGGSRPVTPANANAVEAPAVSESPEQAVKVAESESTKEKDEGSEVTTTTTTATDASAAVSKEPEEIVKAEPSSSDSPSTTTTTGDTSEVPKASDDTTEEKKSDEVPSSDSTQLSPSVSEVFVDAPTPQEDEIADPVPVPETIAAADKMAEADVQEKKPEDNTQEKQEQEEGEGEDTMTVVDTPTAPALSDISAEKESDPPASVLVNGHSDEHADAAKQEQQEKEQQEQEQELLKSPEEKLEEEKKRREKEEWEKANYVGDATWEERTWKEVNRLREDMFWARIGGVRE